ncbi:Cytochrome bo(3) ubiquinol oxidase subunit 2 [Pandoraea captiosa]|uniref:Ubiquinol oxidase subunit 2 n=2 Tax=Pandoraea captiosa TaxID=2508302 RepID=A0A5E5AIJ2_9BURK|nr:Cytochrome bo(3) ubiquinol oxidase subunit 2 [Pandoraea captiosa]
MLRRSLANSTLSCDMKKHRNPRLFRLLALCSPLLLAGCDMTLLDPKGQIGIENKNLILTATWLMLIVVIPVILMTLWFAWKYRATNKSARYEPNWSHSTAIEVVVWLVPIIIIAILARITWVSTHELDPYKPLESEVKPITVEVVALNYKWLFIYPEQGIASINELAVPVDVPVNFKITSESIMNSFFIPQLGSQVYSMAGMETKLHLIANHVGSYDGISANYSGGGFSGMRFKTLAMTDGDFQQWVTKVRESKKVLDRDAYASLVPMSENTPVTYYSSVDANMFQSIVHAPMASGMAQKHEGHENHGAVEMKGMDMKMEMKGAGTDAATAPAAAANVQGQSMTMAMDAGAHAMHAGTAAHAHKE